MVLVLIKSDGTVLVVPLLIVFVDKDKFWGKVFVLTGIVFVVASSLFLNEFKSKSSNLSIIFLQGITLPSKSLHTGSALTKTDNTNKIENTNTWYFIFYNLIITVQNSTKKNNK